MQITSKKLLGIFLGGFIITAICGSLLQNNFGKIDIDYISLVDEAGLTVTAKLYRPLTSTLQDPAPAVLLCHSMNNDKDTEAPLALELAKRGIVALCVDQLNHGDSDPGMKVLASFLSTDDVNANDTIGAQAMYTYLKSLPFVDASRLGLAGHSMGGSTVRMLAKLNPDHRAVIIQTGGPDNLTEVSWMHNYLDIWNLYEELFIESLESRAAFIARGQIMIRYNTALIGESSIDAGYDHNYGNFTLGTAQRYALCPTTHPGGTWNSKSIQESVAWMMQALIGDITPNDALKLGSQQTYWHKESLTLVAIIFLLISIIPLFDLLSTISYFQPLHGAPSTKTFLTGKAWWKTALISTSIGGISFIIIPGIGMIGGGLVAVIIPLFRLLTGNGAVLWLIFNAYLGTKLFSKWAKQKHLDKPMEWNQFGLMDPSQKPARNQYIMRSLLSVGCIFVYLYGMTLICTAYFQVELRFMWPIFKGFTPLRFWLFLIYLIPVYYFFRTSGGFFLFGQMRLPEEKSAIKTQLIWWVKCLFLMEAGLFAIFLIQYLPMFLFQTGPGFSFGLLVFLFGLYSIFLMQILPQFAVIFFLMIALFRRTGKIYVPAMLGTVITTWILAVSGMLI